MWCQKIIKVKTKTTATTTTKQTNKQNQSLHKLGISNIYLEGNFTFLATSLKRGLSITRDTCWDVRSTDREHADINKEPLNQQKCIHRKSNFTFMFQHWFYNFRLLAANERNVHFYFPPVTQTSMPNKKPCLNSVSSVNATLAVA